MSLIKISSDGRTKTWEDENGDQVRVTLFPDEPEGPVAVVRTRHSDTDFSGYTELSSSDLRELIEHLAGVL